MNASPRESGSRESEKQGSGCWLFAIPIFVSLVGISIALLAWLFPFSPTGPSPLEPASRRGIDPSTNLLVNPLAESDGLVWDVTFYGAIELEGPILLQGQMKGARNGLRVDWGVNSPDVSVPPDYFSAYFITSRHFLSGKYCFVIVVDDGAELLVDGEIVRSYWWGYTPGAAYKTSLTLEEGPHTIGLKYFENFENASLHLFWYEGAGSECTTVGHPGVP